ncbi:MAG: hypothetical protein LRY54_03785 [Alphaproteobacteria bacterium]|nr:hypothetical protein [Alphaproteobacteria bacterium]
MDILKTKLQIFLGIIICVLIYKYIHKPPAPEPAVTMEMIEQQAASGRGMDAKAKAAADQMMATGDLGEFQRQLNEKGLIGN